MILLAILLWLAWLLWGANLVRSLAQSQDAFLSQKSELSAGASVYKDRSDEAANLTEAQPGQNKFAQATIEDGRTNLGDLGLSGDMFGSLNALVAALTVAVVLWAGWLQTISLNEARQALRDQMAAMSQQQFSDLLFRVIALTESALDRVTRELPSRGTTLRGMEALDSFADSCFAMQGEADPELARQHFADTEEHVLRSAVAHYVRSVHNIPSSRIGPYLRLLFRQFKLIDESRLTLDEKINYARIARGQLSDGAVLVLALNALSEKGWPFARYIEEYGLLEHLHERYKLKYGRLLRLAFRETAFLGAAERVARREEPAPDPGIRAFDRHAWPPGYVPRSHFWQQ